MIGIYVFKNLLDLEPLIYKINHLDQAVWKDTLSGR